MPNMEVKYSCGHTEDKRLSGSDEELYEQLKWYKENGLCPLCYRLKKQQEREEENKKENQKAAELNKKENWPELAGTEKQILWAEKIRRDFVDKKRPNAEFRDYLLRKITNAADWIENREDLKKYAMTYYDEFKKSKEELENGIDYD